MSNAGRNQDFHAEDFHAWTREQADLLRAGEFAVLDIDHLIEELESRARERRELTSRLKMLLAHLLKWQFQPQRRSPSWEATSAKEQRVRWRAVSPPPPAAPRRART